MRSNAARMGDSTAAQYEADRLLLGGRVANALWLGYGLPMEEDWRPRWRWWQALAFVEG